MKNKLEELKRAQAARMTSPPKSLWAARAIIGADIHSIEIY